MICPGCGKELKNGASFCVYCGRSLMGSANDAPQRNGRADVRQSAPQGAAQSPRPPKAPQGGRPSGKKKNNTAFYVLLAVLFLIMLALAVYTLLIFSGKAKAPPWLGMGRETASDKAESAGKTKRAPEPETETRPTPAAAPAITRTPDQTTVAEATKVPSPEPAPASGATDEILLYEITADVNRDGTAALRCHIEWKVLRDDVGALEWVSVGFPGGECASVEAKSDTVAWISRSESSSDTVQVGFDRAYRAGETVSFDFAVVLDRLCSRDSARTTCTFMTGGFDGVAVDTLTIRWASGGADRWSPDCAVRDGFCVWTTSLAPGETFTVRIEYPDGALGGEPEELTFTQYTGSLKGWSEVRFTSAAASSEVHHNGLIFSAGDAIDGRLDTSWQESADGNGIGEYIVAFFDNTETVRLLGLRLGFATYYERNSRPKTLKLTFSDGTELVCDFRDVNETVYLELSRPIETSFIRYTILDAYSGSEWLDTCITELTAYR